MAIRGRIVSRRLGHKAGQQAIFTAAAGHTLRLLERTHTALIPDCREYHWWLHAIRLTLIRRDKTLCAEQRRQLRLAASHQHRCAESAMRSLELEATLLASGGFLTDA